MWVLIKDSPPHPHQTRSAIQIKVTFSNLPKYLRERKIRKTLEFLEPVILLACVFLKHTPSWSIEEGQEYGKETEKQ